MTSPTTAPGSPAATGSPPADADEVIRTENLTKIYPGDIKAVDGLDLTVRRGEIFGLLGPNGAGKTTTAGMLTTRVIPTSGKAFVGGVDVVAHPALAKRLIGVVAQTNTLDRSLSVWHNLYFHGRFFGMSAKESRAASDRLLEQFRLSERAKAPVLALSGGMAQRLMVARSVMHNPSILFLDEPTAGLDPQSRIALWEILGELHGEGQTILLTTHYMEEADELCNRLAIVDHGKMLALGTPRELKDSMGIDTSVLVTVAGDPAAGGRHAVGRGRRRHRGARGRRQDPTSASRAPPACCPRWSRWPRSTASSSPTSPPPNPRSKPSSSSSPGRTSANDHPRRPCTPRRRRGHAAAHPRHGWSAFKALLTRDAYVLAHNLKEFLPRTLIQPFLLVFVFTYVLPKIGLGIGGSSGLRPPSSRC